MQVTQARLVEMVDRMPAFPQTVGKLLEITADPSCSPSDLVKLIEHDPVMTAKLLKLVNSAYFGLSRSVSSISQAVVFVGINTVKNLAVSVAAIGVLPREGMSGFNVDGFLLHSLGVASVARMVSRRTGVAAIDNSDYFVAGLLHDFGRVVLARFLPQELAAALRKAADTPMPLHHAEREAVGHDHGEIGALLAQTWNLSPELVGAIRYHHELDAPGEWSNLRDCLFAADQVVRSLGFGETGNPVIESFPASVVARLGVDLPGLIAELGDIGPELDKTRTFLQL